MPRHSLLAGFLLVMAALAVAVGCERPFVEESPPRITILSPDLQSVVGDADVTVEVAVRSERSSVDSVRVNGRRARFDPETATFQLDVTLERGVNALRIEAEDAAGNLARATRFGVFLPADFELPRQGTQFLQMPVGLGGHAAVRLADGRVLITGGAREDGGSVFNRAYLLDPADNTFSTLPARMVEARRGHTASLLPDGRVLLAGGTQSLSPSTLDDLLPDAELFDPATETFSRVPLTERSPPVARTEHAAHLVTLDGRSYVYLIGGRGRISLTSTAFGTRSDFRILELVPEGAGVALDSPVNVGPELARDPAALAAFTFTPLGPLDGEGFGAFLLAGTYVAPSGAVADSVALTVTLARDPSYDDVPTGAMTTARTGHAGAAIEPGLVLVAGGRVQGSGQPVPEAEVYAADAGRFFAFPLEASAPRLNVARYGHTATKLADGRILFLGGFDRTGVGVTLAEIFSAP